MAQIPTHPNGEEVVSTDSWQLEVYQGAMNGAWIGFKRGTVEHTPSTIAAEVVCDVLKSGIVVSNPFGFGKKAGFRKAIEVLRKEIRYRKCLEGYEKYVEKQGDAVYGQPLAVKREELLASIFSLPPQAAFYLLGAYYCGLTCKSIGQLFALLNASEVKDTAQRKRLSIARRKLRAVLSQKD